MRWVAAGAVALGFLVALEIVARHYGLPGPMTTQVRELIFPPKSGFVLYAGLALMMVVLTRRERFVAIGAAIGIDAAILLVRWVVGARMTGGHPFGNGALWVICGCAVIAVTRRTGRERVLLLKGVGLSLLLIAGRKTGDTWLLITSKSRPMVLDQYMENADHALGNPSWLVGRALTATGPIGAHVLNFVYGQLPVAAVVVALYQLRRVAVERRFPGHHLVRTFLVIGLLGPAIYMIFPVVGPIYAYGAGNAHWAAAHLWLPTQPTGQWAVANLWPDVVPPIRAPQGMPFDQITPRNCMPSLHTAWATTIFVHSRKGPRFLRWAGTVWLVATLAATLGFGFHYGADLVAGVVFALTIETALQALDRGWDRSAIQLVAHGATVFVAMLLSYRYLSMEMARYPLVFGPLLLLAMASVIHGFVRQTTLRQPTPAPAPAPVPLPAPSPSPSPSPTSSTSG
ncbi:phosphatase PAP2 family protein [Streptomyces sp. NBC_00201]|uniref:phosphatase PAP2 family protein n=1 Tax=unclassified Streptomyces TaxID=2593676 RepID=UPI00224CF9FA|nr:MULTISPECIES: phosphatase PAP2 family protein [unclassified Streptomyces]MCX5055547.1 phosphatase PAP2 family protein [Streptomyces sp. NBC_00452]MCX5247607.1 phosphatase PAP2 family protein [Streptomyces sp. NBC_00201]